MVVYYANELYHHGIQGQKWGVRRYQNPDGTLTSEGRQRYLRDAEKRYGKYTKDVARGLNKTIRYGGGSTDDEIEAMKEGYSKYAKVRGGVLAGSSIAQGAMAVMAASASAPFSAFLAIPTVINGIFSAKNFIRAKKLDNTSIEEIREYADVLNRNSNGQKSEKGYVNINLIKSGQGDSYYQDKAKNTKKSSTNKEIDWDDQGDQYYRDKAKKYGLDQGDNYKMFRDADMGDERAKAAVEKWKKDKVDSRVKKAMSTDKFDMEFLEKSLDVDDRTGEILKGKALENAYRKYLEEEYSK